MNKIKVLFAFAFLGVLLGCESDFPITGDYAEAMAIYGALDASQEKQYVKINRAFLGEGNVLEYAAIADSNQYGDELEVKLNAYSMNGTYRNLEESIILDTTMIHNKVQGDFFAPDQILYTTEEPLNEDYIYEIVAENKETGYVSTSETNIVKEFLISRPRSGGEISFVATPEGLGIEQKTNLRWYEAENGAEYELKMEIYYRERFEDDPEDEFREKVINWTGFSKISSSQGDDGVFSMSVVGDRFFDLLEAKVPYDEETEKLVERRYADTVIIQLAVVGSEMKTYMDVNTTTSSSLVQEVPTYTNIENGYGVFSSRRILRQKHAIGGLTQIELIEKRNMKFKYDYQ